MVKVSGFSMRILALFCMAMCAVTVHADRTPKSVLDLKEGDYLREDYIAKVKRTRSTLAAAELDETLLYEVRNTGNRARFLEVYNFHEGFHFEVDDANKVVSSEDGNDRASVSIRVLSNKDFVIRYGEEPEHRFRWVGEVEAWVTENTVTGKYTDASGMRYTFGSDQRATFPDKTFSYVVSFDHIGVPYDCIYGDDVNWAYAMDGNILRLYEIDEDKNRPRVEPFLILKRSSAFPDRVRRGKPSE